MHMQLVNSYRIPFTTLISYIPVIATVVTCLFSVILARATLRYVEATDKGLALAREEFEREWSPDIHIKMERVSASEAKIIVTNLAKTSVLLQLLQLRKLSHAMPFERCRLNDPLVGGMTWTQEMGRRILACTGAEFEGPIAASMTFASIAETNARRFPSSARPSTELDCFNAAACPDGPACALASCGRPRLAASRAAPSRSRTSPTDRSRRAPSRPSVLFRSEIDPCPPVR